MFVWEVFWTWLGRRGPERRGEGSQVFGGISRIVILVVEGRTTRSFFLKILNKKIMALFSTLSFFSICVGCVN